MYLSGLLGYVIYISFGKSIVVCAVSEIKVINISVLEIVNDLRTLAQIYYSIRGYICTAQGSGYHAFFNAAVACGKEKSVYYADVGIFKSKLYVRGLELNLVKTVCCRKCDLYGLSVRNRHIFAVENDFIRNHNIYFRTSDSLAVDISGYNIGSLCARSGVNAVFNASVHGRINNVFRYLCRIAGSTCARNRKHSGCSGGNILVFRSYDHMVKSIGSSFGRYDYKAAGNTSFGTVGRFVGNNKLVLTLGFASVGCGTAAVKMSCPYAAEVHHYLSLFKQGKTDGFGLIVTVGSKKNNLIIGGNTDSLTGILLCVVFLIVVQNDLIIENEHGINTDSFCNVALVSRIILGSAYFYRTVLKHGKIS